jgi:methylaspartate mutase epsilon subunit
MEARFADFVSAAQAAGKLVVQPRMGFSDPARMRAGLLATKTAPVLTVGTITLDSYTRTGAHETVRRRLAAGEDLNGYPLVDHAAAVTRTMLLGVLAGFPVQVRHGSPDPGKILEAMRACGLSATEGGPVSYCLPYGRVPLTRSVDTWARGCERLAELPDAHLESFGGCMLGQLCPPALLIAITVLECLFFRQHGVRSVSASYAQQGSVAQDDAALAALRTLAADLLGTDWHIVVYTHMGVFPTTRAGSLALLRDSAQLAVRGGAARLIVKTPAEAHHIPSIIENVEALVVAGRAAAATLSRPASDGTELAAEAATLVQAVLDLDADIGAALVAAFARGVLDVPYCLHADNAGLSSSYVDIDGTVRWARVGAMPITADGEAGREPMNSDEFLAALSVVRRRYDGATSRLTSPRTSAPESRTTALIDNTTTGRRPW